MIAMLKRLVSWYWVKLQRVLRRLAREKGTTDRIAMGAAVGMFIGMTPTVGFQMIIAFTAATLLRVNRLAAVLPVWITNPLTVIPIYAFNYWLGLFFWDGPGMGEFKKEMGLVIAKAGEIGFFGLFMSQPEGSIGAWVVIKQLGSLGVDILVPLWIGSLIVGIALALPTYPLMRGLIARIRLRREQRRQARQERIQVYLRDRANKTGQVAKKTSAAAPVLDASANELVAPKINADNEIKSSPHSTIGDERGD